MKSALPPLRKEFWDVNKRLLKISSMGRVYYTDEGKTEYRSLFARHGYVLENVNTLEDFRRVMRNITAMQLEQSTEDILRLIHDPKTSDSERTALAELIGVDPELQAEPPERPTATVVNLADWKARSR